jgi:hypothetical protein
MAGVIARVLGAIVGAIVGAVAVAAMLLAAGCQLDRSGIALRPNPAGLTVSPELACPDDTVGVRWNLANLPRAPENCRRCATSSSCDDGFACIDGVCCRNADLAGGSACNVGGRCLPTAVNMTLAASDPAVAVPALPRPLPLRGGVSLPLAATTDFTAGGSFALPLEGLSDSARARIDDPLRLVLPFACTGTGTGFGWATHDFAALGPSTSDRLRIQRIVNNTRFGIMLTGQTGSEPSRGPVAIEPGASTDAFAGLAPRGRWFGFIASGAGVPMPRCTPTGVADPLPDIAFEMRLACGSKR